MLYTPADFVPPKGIRTPRDPSHRSKHPYYPDPTYYLSHAGKYFFRHECLRHLRIEQVNRYFAPAGTDNWRANMTLEDTLDDEDDPVSDEESRRAHALFVYQTQLGSPESGGGLHGPAKPTTRQRTTDLRSPAARRGAGLF